KRLVAKGTSPEVVLDVQILYRALDKLPNRQREAVILYEISGFSMREIAEIQNSSEGAVKMRVSRGRKALKRLLSDRVTQGGLSPIFTTAQFVLL
ncbi:MAG: RNA polymerase sigma factor, partial [Bacteroidota bacterium]